MGHWGEHGPREPTLQEQRAEDPGQRPQRARKDRRRWCGGHVGREHVPVVRMGKGWTVSIRTAQGKPSCYWSPRYRWLRIDEPIPEGATEHKRRGNVSRYTVIDRYAWSCSHEVGCDRCGKILESRLGRRCPDFRERA